MIPERLAFVLRILAARGFNRETLAARAGISPSYVTLILASPPRRTPSGRVLAALSSALRVPSGLIESCAQPIDDVPPASLGLFGMVLGVDSDAGVVVGGPS